MLRSAGFTWRRPAVGPVVLSAAASWPEATTVPPAAAAVRSISRRVRSARWLILLALSWLLRLVAASRQVDASRLQRVFGDDLPALTHLAHGAEVAGGVSKL